MKSLLRMAGSITTGTILFQAGTAICLISVSFLTPIDIAADFSQSFALAQLIGLTLTFGLTSAVVAELDPAKASSLSGVMAVLSIVVGVLLVLPVLLVRGGTAGVGVLIFALGLALCEALRSEAIGAARMRSVVLNFAGLAVVISSLGLLEVMIQKAAMSLGFAGLALGLLWVLQGHAKLTLTAASWPLVRLSACLHWRYLVFRTTTTFLDFLSSRGVILLMSGLASSYVVFFFLAQRVLAVPVQQLTYALSLSLLRQARAETAEDTCLTVMWVWRGVSLIGVVCLPIMAAGLALATRLNLPFPFGQLEATTTLFLLLYTFYLAYVTWLGRLFDLRSAQATAFVVEGVGKVVVIALLLVVTRQAPVTWFAPTFFVCQAIFGAVWLMALFSRMGWGYGLILRGQVLPLTVISGVTVLVYQAFVFH